MLISGISLSVVNSPRLVLAVTLPSPEDLHSRLELPMIAEDDSEQRFTKDVTPSEVGINLTGWHL
jgi:hypothetical protein